MYTGSEGSATNRLRDVGGTESYGEKVGPSWDRRRRGRRRLMGGEGQTGRKLRWSEVRMVGVREEAPRLLTQDQREGDWESAEGHHRWRDVWRRRRERGGEAGGPVVVGPEAVWWRMLVGSGAGEEEVKEERGEGACKYICVCLCMYVCVCVCDFGGTCVYY